MGGQTTKAKKPDRERQEYLCPNAACGRVFANPIKAENLSSEDTKVYDACPFCLTEITSRKNIEIESKEEKMDIKNDVQAKPREVTVEGPSKPTKCAHHFGYLSKRSANEKIPEDCMLCEHIVQCMLKDMRP